MTSSESNNDKINIPQTLYSKEKIPLKKMPIVVKHLFAEGNISGIAIRELIKVGTRTSPKYMKELVDCGLLSKEKSGRGKELIPKRIEDITQEGAEFFKKYSINMDYIKKALNKLYGQSAADDDGLIIK